ncbi:hypothetical protein LTS08_004537 [Lithohypha guttulata]|nr:hypothetical protein LTS08_004537 [Lithohypha guttulata]
MAGTILHRILSRTKIAPATVHIDTATTDTISSDMPTTHATKPQISFEQPADVRKSSLTDNKSPSMHNARKHSYASVREESDLPQSFRTRKLSSESQIPDDCLPRWHLQTLDKEDENEEAICDDASDFTRPSYDGADSYTDEEEISSIRPRTIEDLPDEILDQIFSAIQLDVTQPVSYGLPRSDLFSCLLVSKALHAAALRMLYKHVLIYRSKTFHKVVTTLQEDAALGNLIQTLDFSHYSHMGYGRSRGQTSVTPYLTKENLKIVLSRTRRLRAFLVHEHLDTELDEGVLSTLFSVPTLQALDFTSCSADVFLNAFTNLWVDSPSTSYTHIRRLCLHECGTLKPAAFEAMLPRLGRLTHLDLAHTRVNDKALLAIPPTAQLTHLNLERCTQLTGQAVVQFLTQHPAAKDTMVWLSLNADASRYRLLSAEDVTTLLPALPKTMRSLNLGGARITPQHVPDLRILATHLEELGLKGANLSINDDITRILSLPPNKDIKLEHPELRSSLRYIDLTDISSVNQMSLCYSPMSIKNNASLPLEVIELGATVLTEIARRNKNVKNPDWTVKELGRRGWYVRSPESLPKGVEPDDGYRSWKMGARWWGMRKLPMHQTETGGVYGYFMFKKN